MLQHVPVAWENAHPVIHTDDVDGVPDRLFKTYFGGHTAYTALLACDKLGLNPNQLLLRSRRAFRSAASDGRINLSIEGRRPGLDEDSQATIRYIIHERKRQMLFVQLFSVRRALVETGTVGPLWQQRQRFVTGKEAPPLNPPPLPEPLEESKTNNSSSGNINSNGSNNNNNKHVRPGDTTGPIQLGRKSLNHSPGNNATGSAKNVNGPDRRTSSRNSEVLPPPAAVNSSKNKNNNDNDNDDDDDANNNNEKRLDFDNWEDQLNQLQRTGSTSNTAQQQHQSSPRSNGSSRRQSGHPQSAASGGFQNISTSSSPGNSSSSPHQLQDHHPQTGRALLLSSASVSKNDSMIGAGGSHSSNGENSNQLQQQQHGMTNQNLSGDQTTLSSSSPPPFLNPSSLIVPYKRKQKITHSPFPVVPEPAPLFRWRTNDTLDKEEQFLSEACSRLVQFCNNFLRAEQSRLHEQLTIQQEDVEERRRKREVERKLHMEQLKTGGVNTSNMTLLNQDEENSFLANPSLMGFAKTSRSDSARPSTAGNVSTIPNGTPNPNTTSASPDFDTSSDDDDDGGDDDEGAVRKKQKEIFSRPTTVGGQCHVAKTPSSYLWTLGESPFSVAGTRPPRPPTQRQQLVTKFGKIVGDDYVSTTVSRHLKIIAKKAAEHISDTVQGNARDDEIREEMHKFHEERKLTKTKITGPLLGRGFEHANELSEAEQRRMALDYHNETLANERINKLVTRHGKQEERKINIDERKLTSHALQREVGQVRRENVKSNRDRIDHLEQARKLVMQVSREGRQERVDLLYQQHRAAAWNSRVSHEMEAMIRAQVKDKVKSMQLTRRWELDELPSAEELAEIFHSGLIMPSWNEGISEGIAPLRQKALEEEERIRREEELLALQQKQQEQKMLDRVGAVTELQMGSNKNNASGGSGVMLPNINNSHNNSSRGNIPQPPPSGSANQSRRSGGRSANEEVNWK